MLKPTVVRMLFVAFLAAAGQIPAADLGAAAPPSRERARTAPDQLSLMAPGVVLVGLEPGVKVAAARTGELTNAPTLNAALISMGVYAIEPVFPGTVPNLNATRAPALARLERIVRLHLAPDAPISAIAQALSASPAVTYAEPDYRAHLITMPNDPLYPQQWALPQIAAPAAWDVSTGSSDTVIAVVDAGLNTTHPDLASQLWTNPGEIPANGLDDDNNGYVDDIQGWNMVDDNGDLGDNTGHGTQVSGVIAAVSDNSEGVAGVCWNCRLMPIKVVQSGGIANYSDVAEGVVYAAQKGAAVINLSLGGYNDSVTLRTAIEVASQTAVVVGGAGNDSSSNPFYPAAYDDHVLAVAGTTEADIKVGNSNYGPWVDVSAPGEGITTTFDGGTYGSTSGTSMAAPFAAGLAGLLRSYHPDWSADLVRAQIIHTADDIDSFNPGHEGLLGSGRIDAGSAIITAAQPLLSVQGHTIDGQPDGRPEPGTTVDLEVTLYNDWADAANVQATLSSSDAYVTIVAGTASFDDIAAYATGNNTTPFRFAVSPSAPYAHDMAFTLSLSASGGYVVGIPFTLSTVPGTVYVHGTLTTQTWTNDHIYIVDNDAGIPASEILTIEPGTVLRFEGYHSLVVDGTLIADGAENQPILFTSNQATPAPGDWQRIVFTDSSVDATFDSLGNYTGGSIVRHALFEYGDSAVYLDDAAPYIAHNTIRKMASPSSGISGGSNNDTTAWPVIADNTLVDAGITMFWNVGGLYIQRNTVSGAGLNVPGAVTVEGNSVSGAVDQPGIITSQASLVVSNRVVDCGSGLHVNSTGLIGGNLMANNSDGGLYVSGSPTVLSNTVAYNGGSGVVIDGAGSPVLHHNNLVATANRYALHNATANAIDATGNWWGTTAEAEIQATIYDGDDEYGLGVVDYSGYQSLPEQEAPAYLHALTILPDTTIGIQTATFDLAFSRPMDQSRHPATGFHGWRQYNPTNSGLPYDRISAIDIKETGAKWLGTWTSEGMFGPYHYAVASFDGVDWVVYDADNSGLPQAIVRAIAVDSDSTVWIGTHDAGVACLEGGTWTIYDSLNSGLPDDFIKSVAIDTDGAKWFGTTRGGVARYDDRTWTVYNISNSAIPSNWVFSIAEDGAGSKWFGTLDGGAARFDGANWTVYDTSNSDLPSNEVRAIAFDDDGNTWFATWGGGVARFDGTTWEILDTSNSGLPTDEIPRLAIDHDGLLWIGTHEHGILSFDGANWTVYDTSNTNLPHNDVSYIAMDKDGSKWFGSQSGGLGAFYKKTLSGAGGQWLSGSRWTISYDFTSLVPRGTYTFTASDATDLDGIGIPADSRFGFSVDYAGEISDLTPPSAPIVRASGVEGDASTVEARWYAEDPESSITGYRYAIGSSAGATDIINWTPTTNSSLARSDLGLVIDRQYWLAVQARNEGGLWSPSGNCAFVAGSPRITMYLPLVQKAQ